LIGQLNSGRSAFRVKIGLIGVSRQNQPAGDVARFLLRSTIMKRAFFCMGDRFDEKRVRRNRRDRTIDRVAVSLIYLIIPALMFLCAIGAFSSLGARSDEPVEKASRSKSAESNSPAVDPERVRAHVFELASAKYEGRKGKGAELAARYVAGEFQKLKLEPLFNKSYFQIFEKEPTDLMRGRNVGCVLRGSDRELADEWIVVSAHHDHLGVRDGKVYPGADDDASGIAMLLETARIAATARSKPKRSIMFISFDLEEKGLYGSRFFVGEPPVPLERVKLFITADLIGGSLAGISSPYVFVMGIEHVPDLSTRLEAAARGLDAIKLGLLGTDIVGVRSDYGPFRARGIPYLFFSTGENPRYHTPDDKPETIDYAKLTAIVELVSRFVDDAARADSLPPWTAPGPPRIDEAIVLRDIMKSLNEHKDMLKIKPFQAGLLARELDELEGVVKRGTITPAERTRAVRVAQLIMITVL
jgi:hypothetical protein